MKRIHWFLLGVLTFILPYTLINNLSMGKEAYHLLLPIDSLIPFVPSFVIFYLITLIYVIVVPYIIIKDPKQFSALARSFIFTMFAAYTIFLLFPVKTVLRPENLANGLFTGLVKMSYYFDAPGFNNFPSLHVALSLLASLIIFEHDKKHLWVWILFIGITLSTMLIKQHYFIDAVAGALLGIIGFMVYLMLR